MLETPGSTFLGMTADEWHAVWYGVLDTFGRFHEAELTAPEQEKFKEKRHYFWLGQSFGLFGRGLLGGTVIYLTSGDAKAAILSIIVLLAGDQALGNTKSK